MSSYAQLMLDHSPYMMMLVEPTQLRIVIANSSVEQALG